MRERARQALSRLALEPIAETTAAPHSSGCRKDRSPADAMMQCSSILARQGSAQGGLEGDVTSCFGSGSKPGPERRRRSTPRRRVRHKAVLLHFLQSGKYAGRVLDEYSTDTTAPQLWRRVFGGSPATQAASGAPDAMGARRPAWLVEHTDPAAPWRCASRLSQAA